MIRITAFKKRYYQFFFKIKVGYLIIFGYSDFIRKAWFDEAQFPYSLATKYENWKRKKVNS